MADRTITLLIPPRLSGSSADRMRVASGGRLPLAELPALPRFGSLTYGIGRVDSGGRVSNGLIVAALGWGEGDRLHLALVGGSVVMHRDPADRKPVPTFDEYIPTVADAVPPGTVRTYGSYWKRIATKWGPRSLLDPTPTEVEQFREEVKTNAVQRRNSRGGRGTAENVIAALRCIYKHAENDRLITPEENPARRTAKPPRLASARHALSTHQMSEINFYAGSTGDDPALDTMLLRLHTESACRTGGALALRPRDLNNDQCLIYLREKNGTTRWQPVSPTLMAALGEHADARGAAADPDGQPLRYRNGKPITDRRHNHLWERLGRYLPWILSLNVSMHWIRHTTLTWVERNFGFAIAHAYAGHFDEADTKNATMTYVKANLHDIATALSALTGESHPLALDMTG